MAGVAAAQITHAAGETGPAITGTHAVVLAARDEGDLLRIADKLSVAGIQHHLVREPDAPWCGQAMAIGLPPGPRQRALAGVRLYRGPEVASPKTPGFLVRKLREFMQAGVKS